MGGSAPNEELLAKTIEREKFSENIQTYLHIDQRQSKLGYNLAWAKTYLKRVRAVNNSNRGIWSLTDAGERMSKHDCEKIPTLVRRQDAERKRAKTGLTDELPDADVTETERSWEGHSRRSPSANAARCT
jgi:restriction system protein